MNAYLVPILSLLLGGVVGSLSTYLSSLIRRHHDITLRLLDRHLEVRADIVGTVYAFTVMPLRKEIAQGTLENHRDLVGGLYYKNYDFLPKPVLESLALLHICLERAEEFPLPLFCVKKNRIEYMKEKDISTFIKKCTTFTNGRYMAAIAIGSNDPTVRRNQSIMLHARYVIKTMNEYMTVRSLLTITATLRKSGLGNH